VRATHRTSPKYRPDDRPRCYVPAMSEGSSRADLPLRDRRQTLIERLELRGEAFCRAYANEADDWLSSLAERATEGNRRHLALLAVGGYGRGLLFPYSDLDIVLIYDGHRDVRAVADAIWYPVWDQGVHLDHSVRQPKEVLQAAEADLRVALGLLTARRVWGDEKLAESLVHEALRRWRSDLGSRWLPAFAEQMQRRHNLQGDVAFLLEPEIKEGHGGLRDAHALSAIEAYAPKLGDYVDLTGLAKPVALLTAIRVELHRHAGRALDRLLLQEQDQLAQRLSFRDADELMASVSEAGRQIAWTVDEAWRRRSFWQPPPLRRTRRSGRQRLPAGTTAQSSELEVEPGLVIVADEVALSADARIAEDSSLPLRLAAVAAERNLPIARSALHRLVDKMAPAPDPWPVETREALVRVLSIGRPAITALEALDQTGLLTRLLPEWEPVRYRPQRNAYHRYTVDRHLLETAANAATLTDRTERPDLLVIGALLHDIGKGYPGDHTSAGVTVVERVARRINCSKADADVLVSMTRLHLLLPDMATRRDLDDPATIETVAAAVGSPELLRLLAALTEADGLATGPSAWTPWKASLVADLVERTSQRLAGGQATPPRTTGSAWLTDRHRALMAEVRETGQPVVVLDPPRVIVAAADRRGLLAAVTGILALHGLDVRSADATSEGGVAVEVFTAEVSRGSWPDTARLREDLNDVLADRLALEHRLAAKAQAYAGERRAWSAYPVAPSVTVDNAASASATIVELRAADELGLLHRVTRALFDCELDVVSARVSTIGHEVVDAFYVRDASGSKVTRPEQLQRIGEALRAAAA